MSYLANLPNGQVRLQRILKTHDVNQVGIYRVKFFINGLRTSVIVDDFIPVIVEGKYRRPAFIYSQKQLFWATLIEKAWAKINGSYAAIRRSSQSFLSIHLTGVPAETIQHSEIKVYKNGYWHTDMALADQIWHRIIQALNRNYQVVANARPKEELYQLNNGIEADCEYEVFNAKTIDHHSKKVRLIQLCNNNS